MKTAAFGMLCVMALAASACGSEPSPIPSGGPSPSASPSASASAAAAIKPAPRAAAGLAYDPISRQLVLIGGMPDPTNPAASDDVPGQDMWAWRPSSGWTRLSPAILPDAGYMTWLVSDSASGRLVAISQSSSNLWSWDGKNWSPVAAVPAHDVLSGVAFQQDLSVLRVLGRAQVNGAETMWTWDGSTWSDPQVLSMSWREQSVVAYDAARRQLVVYGGFGDGDTATWLYDGTTWSRVQTGAAPQAGQSSSAYDAVRQEVVVHVGNQTWTWDGSAWTLRSTTGPALRREEAMTFDPSIGKVMLFGGKVPSGSSETFMSDLWAWDGTAWTRLG